MFTLMVLIAVIKDRAESEMMAFAMLLDITLVILVMMIVF